MANAQKMLILPICGFCGREWNPPEYVSALTSYCAECRPQRLALARSRIRGVRVFDGQNGERVLVPEK